MPRKLISGLKLVPVGGKKMSISDGGRFIKLDLPQVLPETDDLEKESGIIILIDSQQQFSLGSIPGIGIANVNYLKDDKCCLKQFQKAEQIVIKGIVSSGVFKVVSHGDEPNGASILRQSCLLAIKKIGTKDDKIIKRDS